ncbi:MAG: hypothetical protein U0736_18720 [Gemmataceae bacterium]
MSITMTVRAHRRLVWSLLVAGVGLLALDRIDPPGPGFHKLPSWYDFGIMALFLSGFYAVAGWWAKWNGWYLPPDGSETPPEAAPDEGQRR